MRIIWRNGLGCDLDEAEVHYTAEALDVITRWLCFGTLHPGDTITIQQPDEED